MEPNLRNKPSQVEPEFRTGAEEVAESQRGVARDGALAVEDLGDALSFYAQEWCILGV